jgi:DHA1 family bicyclomycin/chloramphenicol resistance-like MFS transporter
MTQRKKMMAFLTVFLGMLAAIAPLSTDMYLPALPFMMEDFSVTPSMIQLTLTASMAGMAAGQIIAGPASDDMGRRKPLVIGMAVFTLSTIGCIFSSSIYLFLAFRFVQGFSGGAGIVIARAIARDVCKGPALTRFFSMLMLVNGLAPILAPVIGGQILRFAAWQGVFVLLVFIGGALTAGAFAMGETLPARRRAAGGVLSSLKGFGGLFRQSYFMGHCLMQCFAFAAFFAYISGSSFVFQNVYHVSPQGFSLIFGTNGIGLMLSGALTGRLAGTVADWKTLRASLWIAVVGSAVLLASFFAQAPLPVIVVVLFITVSTLSALGTSSFSLAMQSQGRNAGSASALIGFFSMISGAVMAPVVGIAGSYTAIPMGVVMVVGELGALLSFYGLIYPAHKNEW